MKKHQHHLIWGMDDDGIVGIHCAHCPFLQHEFVPVDPEGDRRRVEQSRAAHRAWHDRVSDLSESL